MPHFFVILNTSEASYSSVINKFIQDDNRSINSFSLKNLYCLFRKSNIFFDIQTKKH
jgi:hypothetical protein